jgi:hypothetical protein
MAKFAVDEDVVEVVAAVPAKSKAVEEVVPDNVFTLSSGIRVQFVKPLPQSIRQALVISSFNDMNLDSTGRVRDNLSSTEQLGVAKKMYDFNGALIVNGLMSGSLKLYDGLPAGDDWLDQFLINPLIQTMHPFINFEKKLHREFLYLFHNGFLVEEDFTLLSSHLLND